MEKHTIPRAINCTVPQDVANLLENALSKNTRDELITRTLRRLSLGAEPSPPHQKRLHPTLQHSCIICAFQQSGVTCRLCPSRTKPWICQKTPSGTH